MNSRASGREAGARQVRVAVVGGGLAGLAAVAALADSELAREAICPPLKIELFESRRMLGGRATSYLDPETGELVDNCQHVSLGCCTNFDDLCRRARIAHFFERQTALSFLGPNQREYLVRRSQWLPAPLHLAPSLLQLGYLSLQERIAVVKALRQLARVSSGAAPGAITMGRWLREHGQSERLIELFWSPVVVSALSEEVDRASFAMSRKVFVDAFLRHKHGYEMIVPRIALRTIYDHHLARWLRDRGVMLHLGKDVRTIETTQDRACSLLLSDGDRRSFDLVCVAVPWFRLHEMLEPCLAERLNLVNSLKHFEEVPITSVHLWCKWKLLFVYRHAVLPGRFSQWIFSHTKRSKCPYYQVVISASREAASMAQPELIARVCKELEEVSGEPVNEILVGTKVITERRAVFSPSSEIEQFRPAQMTPIPNLFLAGDWTATGWPATMEGAVRSGYLAAEAMLRSLGVERKILVPDLPAARLSRWLLGVC